MKFEFLGEMLEEVKSSKSGVDIGDGFRVMRVGHDTNGNWSYWISKNGGRAKKVQSINLNGGKGKIEDLRDFRDSAATPTINAIKSYFREHIGESLKKKLVEKQKYEVDFSTNGLDFNVFDLDFENVDQNGVEYNCELSANVEVKSPEKGKISFRLSGNCGGEVETYQDERMKASYGGAGTPEKFLEVEDINDFWVDVDPVKESNFENPKEASAELVKRINTVIKTVEGELSPKFKELLVDYVARDIEAG